MWSGLKYLDIKYVRNVGICIASTSYLLSLSHCKSRPPQSSSKNITVESADGTNVMLVYKDPENNNRLGIRLCAELTVLEDLPKDTSPKEAISKQLTACGGSGKDSWSGTPQVFMGKMLEAIKTVEPDSNDQELLAAINQVKTFDPNQHKNLSASDLKLKESRQKLEVELLRARRFAKGLEVTEPQGKILSDKIKGLETEIAKFDAEIKSLQEKIKSADPAQLTAAEETIETRLMNIMENVILATTTIRYNPIGKDKYGYRVLSKVLGELVPGGVIRTEHDLLSSQMTEQTKMATGGNHTCAITEKRTVKCWGLNVNGQLGTGDTKNRSVPSDVVGLTDVKSIAAGDSYTCALLMNGKVKCWGYNIIGQLGTGDTINRLTPSEVVGLTNIKSIAAGSFHTCAITDHRNVKCWGENGNGQLGTGDTSNRLTPTNIEGLSNPISIGAGYYQTCALLEIGIVKCWGHSVNGHLGKGDSVNKSTPTEVAGLTNIKSIDVGSAINFALARNGTVKCWGNYNNIQHPACNTLDTQNPIEIAGLTNIKSISAGDVLVCAVTENSNVKCRGNNERGQLGTGDTMIRSTPSDVVDLTNIKLIDIGNAHTCALTANDKIKCWGRNEEGQLGNGGNYGSTVPVDVVSFGKN